MVDVRKILVVEDDPNDIELILEALTRNKLNNRVVVLNDGVQAMEYLQYEGVYKNREKEHPALILLDIKMPRMDGIEVLKAIKTSPLLKTIPVVMLTSSNEESDLKKCYELGANAYVIKSLRFGDFFETIKSLVIFWVELNKTPFND
jgi:CheY-like chemotaxis protein